MQKRKSFNGDGLNCRIQTFIRTVFRGLGQIMLQENALTGLFFLAGIFYGSPVMGLAALLAVVTGTVTAMVMGYDSGETKKGLYGFSPALVGVALVLYFEPRFTVWAMIVAGAAAAAMLQHFFIVKKLPAFTFPFVLVAWISIFILHRFYPMAPASLPPFEQTTDPEFAIMFRGYGQVIFQGSILAGFLFFAGVLANSRTAAVYGIAGGMLSTLLAALLSAPADALIFGLFGYNAVLSAIALSGNKAKDLLWALLAVILTLLISMAMFKMSLIQLTFPFVAGTVITLMVKKRFLKVG